MSTMYITDPGTTLSVTEGQFIATVKNGLVRKVPQEQVDAITVFGNAHITTPCVQYCLREGVTVHYFSTKGAYFGKLSSTRHISAKRLKQQVHTFSQEDFSLALAKKIVGAKIHNQKVILRRYQRNNELTISEQIKSITAFEKNVNRMDSIAQLMGIEGICARYYFQALSTLVTNDFVFKGRSKQPPKDAFNSMLSLGYTLLLYEIYAEIESRGLSPYIGFLHSEQENHPALASDLMEEWRAFVVDATVLSLVQGNELNISDFVQDENTGGVFITDKALKIFVRKLNQKFFSANKYLTPESNSIRREFYLQTVSLTHAIEQQNPELYQPLSIW